MTCGMLRVMRRERRGVLHLDKYSPPKANWFGGGKRREKGKIKREKEKEKKEERQWKGKRTSKSLINKERSCSSERIYASRGRGSLLLWLIFISEP